MPPRWFRRLVMPPVMLLLTALVVITLPLTIAVAAVVSLVVPGMRRRPLRVLAVLVVHLVLESVALVTLFAAWVVSGFGRGLTSPTWQRWHYDLVDLYLRAMFAAGQKVLRVQVRSEGPDPSAYRGRPLLVFCRHAGPGDSFLLVHALTHWYDREPRIVLKDTLQWDPAIDVVLNRLPSTFIGSARGRKRPLEDEIGDLAHRLDGNDALVLFPEGGNFTEYRRARTIERLRRKGHLDDAAKAEAMRNVLAPRPGGVLAALAASRGEADVVWVAHTGTDHLHSAGDVWRELPMDTTIRMHWWLVPPDEIPSGRDEQIAWLFEWWQRIDAWIDENRPSVTPGPPSGDTARQDTDRQDTDRDGTDRDGTDRDHG